MDEKKVQAITDILSADPVFAVKVIELNPEDAAKEFAAKGLPVSEDDLTAYGRLIDEAKALSQTVGALFCRLCRVCHSHHSPSGQ